MSYIIAHTKLWFCWWDIPAAIILAAVTAIFIIRRRRLKKQEKRLENYLAELEAERVPISMDTDRQTGFDTRIN